MPDEHARFSLSASKQWLNCPGWGRLTKGIPPRPGSADSEYGVKLHGTSEGHLKAWTIPGSDLSQEDLDIILPYIHHCRAVKEATGGDMVVETRVNVDGPDCWGTLDCAHIDTLFPSIDVSDLKTGQGYAVDAENNSQLSLYACGILLKHFGKPAAWKDVVVRIHIVQPRRRDGKGAVDTWETTGAHMAEFFKQAKKVLKEQRAETGAPVAGAHCKYCPAEATCPARLCQAANVFPALVSDVPVEAIVAKPVAPETLDAETIHRVWELSDQIRSWLDAVDAEILRRGGISGKTKVVEGRAGNRQWIDEIQAATEIRKLGIEPWVQKIKGVPEIEKDLGGKAKAAPVIQPLVRQAPGKPTLVRADDPRPALDAASVFPALDTQ